ncbi:MAG TPA: propanediol utilization protein [Cyanobacteria bacterium UBA8530]|nr:propanediol utilization protein [Cyanobacteria bacterium UBA8530]
MDPAIGMIELNSIAYGILVTDAIAKKAPVRIHRSMTTCPGKYLVLFSGEVAAVEESFHKGGEVGAETVVDELFLPHVHPSVAPALDGVSPISSFDSLGVFETFSLASAIIAADKAVKATEVQLIEIRSPAGLGGKSFFVITGNLEDVQAAMEEATASIKGSGMLVRQVVIPNPHEDLNNFLF